MFAFLQSSGERIILEIAVMKAPFRGKMISATKYTMNYDSLALLLSPLRQIRQG
jgi:hypothetical protein